MSIHDASAARHARAAPQARRLGAAELAWAVIELVRIGCRVRALDHCVGELGLAEVRLGATGLSRAPCDGALQRRLLERRRARHLRAGHDLGCALFGVPLGTIERLLRAWGTPRALGFARALVDEALDELRLAGVGPLRGWSPERAAELAEHVIRSRITPRRPVGLEAGETDSAVRSDRAGAGKGNGGRAVRRDPRSR